MKKLVLAGLLAITPVTFAETLEHVEEEVHIAMETIQQLKAELNELKAAVKMQGEVQEASVGRIAKAAKKFEKIHLGGYGELHYKEHETDGGSKTKNVDAHRFVLFFGYDYNEKVRFRSEFELEHGLVADTADGSNGGEVELEQMYIEIDLTDETTTQAGVILLPVGILNENHEPPTFYGVERNDVEKYLIPSTWWAAGVKIAHKMSNGITLEAMVSEGLKGATSTYIRDGRQKSADADASKLAYTARITYTGMPGLKASLFFNHQSDFTQDSTDNIEEMDMIGATAIYNFGDGFEVRALHVQNKFGGKDESAAFFTNGFDEHQGTFLEVSKRTGNLGVYMNQAIVSGEKVSRQYTVQTAGFSYWPQGTNTVFKLNYYDKEYSSESLSSSNSDGFDLGMGYEF
jgi:FtsZ-binding cell division protein ZapB